MRIFRRGLNSFLIVCLALSIACSRQGSPLPGYIEGEYTYIASQVTGTLFELAVKRGQQVAKGDLVFRLDPEPEKANYAASLANIANLQAQADFAKIQFQRQKTLYPGKATPKTEVDRSEADFISKFQQLVAAKAELAKSEWSLQQKTAYAPISGLVFDTYYRLGEDVEANHPVLAILAPTNIKVLFYIPENSLSQIALGQEIEFGCDNCKTRSRAKISYISPEAEYTPPIIYSKDTRYKLVYLVRADLPPDIAKQFHPGQPIDVYLHYAK